MEIQVLSLNDALEIMKNPEHDSLIVWYATWSAPSACFLRNLKEMPEIENVKIYKIDIESPPIELDRLRKLGVNSIPTSFFLKKGIKEKPRRITGNLNYEKILRNFRMLQNFKS